MKEPRKPAPKKPYRSPELVAWGSVEALTKALALVDGKNGTVIDIRN